MIGYIPVRHIQFEGTDQGVLDPSPVYATEHEAQAAADLKLAEPALRVHGEVWEIDLDSDPRIARVLEIAAHSLGASSRTRPSTLLAAIEEIQETLAPEGEPFRTPEEWMEVLNPGVRILDADGWQQADAPPFNAAITREEFSRRIGYCTLVPA